VGDGEAGEGRRRRASAALRAWSTAGPPARDQKPCNRNPCRCTDRRGRAGRYAGTRDCQANGPQPTRLAEYRCRAQTRSCHECPLRLADALPGQVNWIPTSSTYRRLYGFGCQNNRIRKEHPNAFTLTDRLRNIEDLAEQDKIFPLSSKMSSNSDPLLKNRRWPRGRFQNTRRLPAGNAPIENCWRGLVLLRESCMIVVQNGSTKLLNRRSNSGFPRQNGRYLRMPGGPNSRPGRFMAELQRFQVPLGAFLSSSCF
jgi:hypothetical protein